MFDTFFHIGILVNDLDKAVDHYSKLLGVKFTDSASIDAFIEGPNDTHYQQKVTACYSRTKEPYYELIQAGGDGAFSEKYTGQIFYFGIWESDMDKRLATLRTEGIGIAAIMRQAKDGPITAIITEPDSMGARMEYVNTSLRLAIDAWILLGKI